MHPRGHRHRHRLRSLLMLDRGCSCPPRRRASDHDSDGRQCDSRRPRAQSRPDTHAGPPAGAGGRPELPGPPRRSGTPVMKATRLFRGERIVENGRRPGGQRRADRQRQPHGGSAASAAVEPPRHRGTSPSSPDLVGGPDPKAVTHDDEPNREPLSQPCAPRPAWCFVALGRMCGGLDIMSPPPSESQLFFQNSSGFSSSRGRGW